MQIKVYKVEIKAPMTKVNKECRKNCAVQYYRQNFGHC